jgi:Thioesterase superfamily
VIAIHTGFVFYPRCFEFFDAGSDALLEPTGLPRQKMLRTCQIDGIPFVEFRTSFLRPSRYGDTLVIESRFLECRWNSCSVRHNGKVLAVEGVGKKRTGRANQAHFVAIQRPSDSEEDQRTGFAWRGLQ